MIAFAALAIGFREHPGLASRIGHALQAVAGESGREDTVPSGPRRAARSSAVDGTDRHLQPTR